jgi:predicted phosphate transport protein (TIGR00153 family)
MLRKLMPRETDFFDYFERHAATTVRGCRELLELATTGREFEAHAKRIKDLEHEADSITHDCVEALHKTFITPLDRDDIHRLISRMDDIMDFVETVSDQCVLYNVESMRPDARELAEVLVESTEQLEIAIQGLRDMKNARLISERCIDVNRLENEGDEILRKAVARLFDEERDPVSIIKWKEIYENLETATDRCEDVANVLEGIVLEHA